MLNTTSRRIERDLFDKHLCVRRKPDQNYDRNDAIWPVALWLISFENNVRTVAVYSFFAEDTAQLISLCDLMDFFVDSSKV